MYILRLLKRFGFNDDELLSVYKMLCQTRCWICWRCLVFLYHCGTEENFGTPAKTRVQNHFRMTALYTTYAAALETCGLESFADRSEGHHCRGFAEGLANSERTNNLLPPTRLDWSLTPATCVMQVITLNCASEHHASKKSNLILYQPLKSVNRHWLSEQFYHFVIPCEPPGGGALTYGSDGDVRIRPPK